MCLLNTAQARTTTQHEAHQQQATQLHTHTAAQYKLVQHQDRAQTQGLAPRAVGRLTTTLWVMTTLGSTCPSKCPNKYPHCQHKPNESGITIRTCWSMGHRHTAWFRKTASRPVVARAARRCSRGEATTCDRNAQRAGPRHTLS